jgi:adenylate cyclase
MRRWPKGLNSQGIGIALVTGIAIALGTATAQDVAPLHWLELNLQTVFFRLRGPLPPHPSLAIVAMDDDSLNRGADAKELKALEPIQSWPWRRTAYATVIDRLMAAGAKAVVMDVILDAPSDRPQDDQQLRQVLTRYAGRVTLAAMYATSETDLGGLDQLIYPTPIFRTQPESIGFINFQPEIDGQFRRFTDRYLQQIAADVGQPDRHLTSLDVAALQAAGHPSALTQRRGDYIHFYGGQGTFPTLSFWRILEGKSWANLQQQQIFKNKIVLIGPTARVLQDIHPTPFGPMPGVEIHAHAIATLQDHRALWDPLSQASDRGGSLTLGLLGVALLLYCGTQRPVRRFGGALAIALGWGAIGYGAFLSGMLLPVAVPVLGIVLSGLAFWGHWRSNGKTATATDPRALRFQPHCAGSAQPAR